MGSDIEFDQGEANKILPALDNLGGDAEQGRQYIERYMSLSFAEEGIINQLSGAHDSIRDKVDDHLRDLRTYFGNTLSDNFRDTFRLYDTNEADAEATLRALEGFYEADAKQVAKIRASDREPWGKEPATGKPGRPFAPPEHPADHYKPVSVGSDAIQSVSQPPGVLDYFSVTFYTRMIIEMVTGHDALELLGRPIAGDWDQFILIAKALRHLADGISAVSTNLVAHVDQLEAIWGGNAYMACNLAVHNAADDIQSGTVDPLRAAADVYEEAALAAHQTYQDIAPIMSAIIDVSTGIGLVKSLLGGASSGALRLAGQKVDDVLARISEFQATVVVLKSKLDGISADFDKLKRTEQVPPVLDEYRSR